MDGVAMMAALAGRVLGDVGTPMMLAGPCHLLFGNLVIGVAEGLLIGKLFKVKRLGLLIGVMVLANYVSMLAGVWVRDGSLGNWFADWFLGDRPLTRVGWLLVVAAVVTYVLTVLIEWPFVRLGMGKGVWRTLGASVMANAASYLVLVLLYGMITEISLITVSTVVERGLAKDSGAEVYFVDWNDRGVYRMKLDGTGRERVGTRVVEKYRERLQLVKGSDGKMMDVCVVKGQGGAEVLAAGVMEAEGVKVEDQLARYYESGPAVDLRGEGKREWEVRTGFWPMEGLRVKNVSTGELWRLALETPFMAWWSSSATILPGEQVVYEVGGQVVLVDLGTKRMAFLARGSSPVVVIAKE